MATTTPIRENRELLQREFDEAWNGNDLDVLDEIYADGVVVGTKRTGVDDPIVDVADIKSMHGEWDAAFPDATIEVNAMTAEGDVVLAWWTLRGTHEGTFRGIEATGNEIEVDGFSFRRIEDGKVVELKDSSSMATLLEQLGRDLPF